MKTVIEMAHEVYGEHTFWTGPQLERLKQFAELVRADERNSWPAEMEAMERQVNILTDALAKAKVDEREQIAQMIEDAPTLMPFSQNEHGGCLLCGFTPRLAASFIRARSNT